MAGPRARRRPLVLLLVGAALITVVVLIGHGASNHRPDATEAVQAYLDQLRPDVQTSTSDGADFADIRANAASLGREGIDTRLGRLTTSVKTTLNDVEGLVPPPSMRLAQAYLVAALGVRVKGVTEAKAGFDAALTEETSPDQGVSQAVTALAGVGQDLELGDRAYGLFTGALPRNVTGLPPSAWVTDGTQWSTVELTAFVTTLRSAATLTPVHDLAMIAYQTDPPAVGIQNGAQIIPSGPMAVAMVVQNVGNQTEHNVTINATLVLSDGSTQGLRDFIDLAPGQRRAITLKSMHPAPGTSGTLTVTVQPVAGETNLINNTLTTPVQFR